MYRNMLEMSEGRNIWTVAEKVVQYNVYTDI